DNMNVAWREGGYLGGGRLFYKKNNGAEECNLGSADLMPRNLNRRVEVIFPVERPQLVQRLKFYQAEEGIRDWSVTGVQTGALPISVRLSRDRAIGRSRCEGSNCQAGEKR